MNHRRYIVPYMGAYHLPAQVVFDTWRAADCRPYNTFVSYFRIFDVSITVLRFKKCENMVRCRPWILKDRYKNVGLPNNCQLSIVNCQFKKLSTVNCQLYQYPAPVFTSLEYVHD